MRDHRSYEFGGLSNSARSLPDMLFTVCVSKSVNVRVLFGSRRWRAASVRLPAIMAESPAEEWSAQGVRMRWGAAPRTDRLTESGQNSAMGLRAGAFKKV